MLGNGVATGDAGRLLTGLYRVVMAGAVALLGWLGAHQFDDIKTAIHDAAVDAKAAAMAAHEARAQLDKRAAEIAGDIDSLAVSVSGHEQRIDRLEDWRDSLGQRR